MNQKATLREIEEHWSFADVLTANLLLDTEIIYGYLAQQDQ